MQFGCLFISTILCCGLNFNRDIRSKGMMVRLSSKYPELTIDNHLLSLDWNSRRNEDIMGYTLMVTPWKNLVLIRDSDKQEFRKDTSSLTVYYGDKFSVVYEKDYNLAKRNGFKFKLTRRITTFTIGSTPCDMIITCGSKLFSCSLATLFIAFPLAVLWVFLSRLFSY